METKTPIPHQTKTKKKIRRWIKKRVPLIVCGVILILAAVIFLLVISSAKDKTEPEIISASTLEKIIRIEELSTATAVYNGITEVKNEKNDKKTDYYIAYEARVKAGIKLNEVNFAIDYEKKEIVVTIPKIEILDIDLDENSLDFMFVKDKANEVSELGNAITVCNNDIKVEVEKTNEIYELARKTAIRKLTALIEPLMDQLDASYTLTVE